ncbi:uncharacterized protein LOC107647443 [Arachis ipaensis]|uniref:uncharacterized protein LOC107647443 n=1 Tax=Arachis ipaensis TaxID=130454 RepID=UPI0007AF42C8|nr:uncharacterized protein LOC107647443 [Arachis ipaensis]XP_025627940.1 uncharacterized protein LOC112721080 [Arachis hypogaea]
MVTDAHKYWSEYLPLALWTYRTTRHGTSGVTPFSLVYGVEAVLPAEIEVPTARMLLDEARDREVELQELEEKREVVGSKMEEYHRRLALAYDKHVRPRVFLEGDLVLKSVDAVMRKMSLPKWAPKWEGPYIVSEVHPTDTVSCWTQIMEQPLAPSISSMSRSTMPNFSFSSLNFNSKRLFYQEPMFMLYYSTSILQCMKKLH